MKISLTSVITLVTSAFLCTGCTSTAPAHAPGSTIPSQTVVQEPGQLEYKPGEPVIVEGRIETDGNSEQRDERLFLDGGNRFLLADADSRIHLETLVGKKVRVEGVVTSVTSKTVALDVTGYAIVR